MSPTNELPGVYPAYIERLLFPRPVAKDQLGVSASFAIDFAKVIYAFAPIFALYSYNAWSNPTAMQAWAQLAAYGFLWISKGKYMPDVRFGARGPISYFFVVFASLVPFWLVPYFVARSNFVAPPWRSALSTFSFGIGLALHFASDMQKHMFVQAKIQIKKIKEEATKAERLEKGLNGEAPKPAAPGAPKQSTGLLTEGIWAHMRNPNYVGELFIYGSFCILSPSPIPPLNLAVLIATYWYPSMQMKDRSLTRYKEFAEWKKNSWQFIPGLY